NAAQPGGGGRLGRDERRRLRLAGTWANGEDRNGRRPPHELEPIRPGQVVTEGVGHRHGVRYPHAAEKVRFGFRWVAERESIRLDVGARSVGRLDAEAVE